MSVLHGVVSILLTDGDPREMHGASVHGPRQKVRGYGEGGRGERSPKTLFKGLRLGRTVLHRVRTRCHHASKKPRSQEAKSP